MKLKWLAVSVVLLAGLGSQAEVILWDINEDSNPDNQGSVADFTAMGVAGDLTGATVSQVIASTNSTMTDGTVSLSYLSGIAQSATSYTQGNGVLADYLYLQDGANAGPVTMQISGLSAVLLSDTTYYLYLIGAGDSANQGAQFTFDSVTHNTTSASTDPDAAVSFTFTTGSTVADTLDFTWERTGSNTYSAFNGFAIVAVPEPATIGLVGIFGALLFLSRRSTALKKWAR